MDISENALEQISQAAQIPDRWLPAADTAAAVLKNESWRQTHPSAGDWVNDAARRAGYSVNAFRRQVRVADFLRSKVDATAWPGLLQKSLPFGNLELLQRMFDANPGQAAELLPTIIKGGLTYRTMRDLYQKAQEAAGGGSGKKLFANRSQRFMHRAIECIHEHQEAFVGAIDSDTKIEFHTGTRGFPYARPDLLVIGVSKQAGKPGLPMFVDAFEMKLFGMDDSKQIIVRTLEQALLMESLFRQVWLVYPSSTPPVESHEEHVQELSFHLIALGMDSIGVALIPEDSNSENPKAGTPEIRRFPVANTEPKRGHLLTSYLRSLR